LHDEANAIARVKELAGGGTDKDGNIRQELITLQKFMKDNTLRDDHKRMLGKLDDHIENKLVKRELEDFNSQKRPSNLGQQQSQSPEKGPGAFGADEGEQPITQIFTR
jgi:hypothetical protein